MIKTNERILCGILSATVLMSTFSLSVSATEIEHPDILFGDVNVDGRISIADATEIQRYIVQLNSYNVLDLVNDEGLLDINHDREVNIADATTLQQYLAQITKAGCRDDMGAVAYTWCDAEYEDIEHDAEYETVTVTDKPAWDEEVTVVDRESYVEKVPVYKSGYGTICNDCDEALYHDDGTVFSGMEIAEHMQLHRNGTLPVTAHDPIRYYLDAYGDKCPINPDSFTWAVTHFDENGKGVYEIVYYSEDLPLYHNGASGSYRWDYSDKIPTGKFTEKVIPEEFHYETVHHEAITHEETVLVKEAWTEHKLVKPEGYYKAN